MKDRKSDIFTGIVLAAVFILMAVFPVWASSQTTQPFLPLPTTQPATTQPVFLLSPPPNTIIQNVSATCNPWGSVQAGVGANNSRNLTVRNCRLEGFNFPLMFTGANPGLHITYCVILNSSPPPQHSSGTDVGDTSGIYEEGGDGDEIDHCLILNCGWWAKYDVTDPVQRSISSRHHGIYRNESHGTTTYVKIHDNIILNCPGSQVGCRIGGQVYGNVFMSGFDRDVILGGNGSGQAQWGEAFGNVLFGPWYDGLPYYGGGINLVCPGLLLPGTNLVSNSAGITNNFPAVDASGNIVIQTGYWSKGGASPTRVGQKVPRLADYYGAENFFPLIHCDDAPKIIAWLGQQLVSPVQPSPVILGNGVTVQGQQFQVIAK